MKALVPLLAVFCALGAGVATYSDTATVTAKAKPAVVFVRHRDSDGHHYTGSGFIIAPGGYIVTCAHVVEPGASEAGGAKTSISDKVWVRVADGTTHEAERCLLDRSNDLAILRVPGDKHQYLELEQAAVIQGQEVLVLGHPVGQALGKEMAVTRGIVSALRNDGSVLQLDAAINAGSSGSPVLNQRGRVVGIAFAKLPGFEGTNFAVSASKVNLYKVIPANEESLRDLHPALWLPEQSKSKLLEARRFTDHPESPDQIDRALRLYEEVLADPLAGSSHRQECYRSMADIYDEKTSVAYGHKEPDAATEWGRKAVTCRLRVIEECQDPRVAGFEYRDLASTYNVCNRYAEAVDAAKLAVNASLRCSEQMGALGAIPLYGANCELGKAYIGLRQFSDAESYLKAALAVYSQLDDSSKKTIGIDDKSDCEAHYELGRMYVEKGDKARALGEYAVLKTKHPVLALLLLTMIHEQ